MKTRILVTCSLLAPVLLAQSARAQAVLYQQTGLVGDRFGTSVTFLPDVNGDFVEDYAVGLPFDDPQGDGTVRGSVRLYSGKYGSVLRVFPGEGANSEFGHSIAAVPDVDGDGRSDLLIGAPSQSTFASHAGAAFVFSSATGAKLLTYMAGSPDEYFGHCVANLGDLDGDGTADWAIGAPFADAGGYTNNGRVLIYSGSDLSLLREQYFYGDGAQFGWSLAAAGDVSGDGKGDYAVGAPGAQNPYTQQAFAGSAWAFRLGSTSAMIGVYGTEPFEQLGWSVAGLGDVNSDGRADVAIGAPFHDGASTNIGRVVVQSGANNTPLYSLVGASGWKLGTALANVGDHDGDGVDDLGVGAPGYWIFGTGEAGLARVHSGVDGSLLELELGSSDGCGFGSALAGHVDVNNDGRAEWLVGAPYDGATGNLAGSTRLFLGDTTKPSVYGVAKTNSAGCTPKIAASGVASRSVGNNLHLTASNVLPNKTGVLFWGFAQANAPFGGGTLLVGQPLVRTPAQNSGGGSSACDGTFDFHFSQALMSSYNLAPGTTIYAQYWYRDPGFALPNNLGLTNAVRFEIVD